MEWGDEIIRGSYTENEAHEIMMWINRIKSAQMTLMNRLDTKDCWAAHRIVESAWLEEEDRKEHAELSKTYRDFEKQFNEELLSGGYQDDCEDCDEYCGE